MLIEVFYFAATVLDIVVCTRKLTWSLLNAQGQYDGFLLVTVGGGLLLCSNDTWKLGCIFKNLVGEVVDLQIAMTCYTQEEVFYVLDQSHDGNDQGWRA